MNYMIDLAATLQKVASDIKLDALQTFITRTQGTVWVAGNGGSASTAQHWACDLSKAAGRRVQALGSNPAVLTAWANDSGYEDALAKELRRLARDGDSVIALSCSGTSENIVNVLGAAKQLHMPCALVSGPASFTERYPVDILIRVPHTHYGVLEDCFMAIGHWLTEQLRHDAAMPRRVDNAILPYRSVELIGDAE